MILVIFKHLLYFFRNFINIHYKVIGTAGSKWFVIGMARVESFVVD